MSQPVKKEHFKCVVQSQKVKWITAFMLIISVCKILTTAIHSSTFVLFKISYNSIIILKQYKNRQKPHMSFRKLTFVNET